MQPSVYRIPLDLPGSLWIMPRPKAEWLAEEIAAYHLMGMRKIISLLSADEAELLGLAGEEAACRAQDIAFTHYPILDRSIASDAQTFGALARDTLGELRQGTAIGIHCRAGIGRSGMLACSVLGYHGMAAEEAIAVVREARGVGVPDTDAQATFIRDLIAALRPSAGVSAHGKSACS
jgi:protein-tyrosine phosphatase